MCYHNLMTRTEAIAIINAKLASRGVERVITGADFVQGIDTVSTLPRRLTANST